MKKSLINEGVKEEDIVLDYAGFRTFDSVVRAKLVFQQKRFIIVSQKFHLERALFIAQSKNIEAYGFVASSSSDPNSNIRQHFRESFARLLSILDCYIFNTKPKFLGEKYIID